jgi:hypothetical protein
LIPDSINAPFGKLGGDELDEVHLSSNLITKNGRSPLDRGPLQDAIVMSASSEVAVILLIFACRHKGLPLYLEPTANRLTEI